MMARQYLSAALGAVFLAALAAGSARAAGPEAAPQKEPGPIAQANAPHANGDMPGGLTIVLVLGGVLASLILIRGPVLRRARETVKRFPGDAPEPK